MSRTMMVDTASISERKTIVLTLLRTRHRYLRRHSTHRSIKRMNGYRRAVIIFYMAYQVRLMTAFHALQAPYPKTPSPISSLHTFYLCHTQNLWAISFCIITRLDIQHGSNLLRRTIQSCPTCSTCGSLRCRSSSC
jgi:hypothetical protein